MSFDAFSASQQADFNSAVDSIVFPDDWRVLLLWRIYFT